MEVPLVRLLEEGLHAWREARQLHGHEPRAILHGDVGAQTEEHLLVAVALHLQATVMEITRLNISKWSIGTGAKVGSRVALGRFRVSCENLALTPYGEQLRARAARLGLPGGDRAYVHLRGSKA